ncbi:TPA: hypothetical protein DCR79_01505, partial [Patescibacteria group bacterium]|nr:hypothetical protein [Patescibacteria group bacterium]
AATVISQFIAYGWLYLLVYRRFNLHLLAKIYRMILATIIMVMITRLAQYFQINTYLVILLAILTYGLALIALKEPLAQRFSALWRGSVNYHKPA